LLLFLKMADEQSQTRFGKPSPAARLALASWYDL